MRGQRAQGSQATGPPANRHTHEQSPASRSHRGHQTRVRNRVHPSSARVLRSRRTRIPQPTQDETSSSSASLTEVSGSTTSSTSSSHPTEEDTTSASQSEVWEVERIVDARRRVSLLLVACHGHPPYLSPQAGADELEYRARYRGYSSRDDCWIPASAFMSQEHFQQCLDEFNQRQQGRLGTPSVPSRVRPRSETASSATRRPANVPRAPNSSRPPSPPQPALPSPRARGDSLRRSARSTARRHNYASLTRTDLQ